MTADEFVRAMKQAANEHTLTVPDNPFLKERQAVIKTWSLTMKRRPDSLDGAAR